MRFKCSLNNNYEIIGLCDLKKFNQKINEFKDRSWNQISLSKLINLSNKKLKIKTITKVFVSINIISNKFVDTPLANIASIEGFNITGKILLISGQIYFNIIYISDTKQNSLSSFKVSIPFSTYIVLDETFDNQKDKYVIYPFIEDISLRKLDSLSLLSNINLFLFANKIMTEPIPPPPPPIVEKLPNKITIKSINNQEVLTIEFNKKSQKFIVNSAGIIPDISSSEIYLTFILKNKNGDILIKTTLNSNETGDNFKTVLNNKDFKYKENILTFIYKDRTKIEISNFPTKSESYVPDLDFNIFSLEQTGLVDIAFKSNIKIINDDGKEISSMYFSKPLESSSLFSKIISTSTSLISTNTLKQKEQYVEYLQYDENNVLFQAKILSRETASNFSNSLDRKNIKIGSDILRLSNRIKNRIILTNYNGIKEYIVEEEPEFFLLADDKFTPHTLNYDKIRFKNNDNSNILFIYFDKILPSTIYIQSYSTGTSNKDSNFFSFRVLNSQQTIIKIQGRINKNQTGDVININPPFNISNNLSIGDILEINSSNPALVEILKFPYTSSYNLISTSQKFIITKNGLTFFKPPPPPPTIDKLPNTFTFYSNTSQEIGKVEFDKQNNKLIVFSTGVPYNLPIVFNAFIFELRDSKGVIIKNSSTIVSNSNANNFKNTLNDTNFEYGDLIYLGFFDSSKVILSNYPNVKETYKMKSFNSQGFKITANGIIPYLFLNEIILNDINNQSVIIIQFDALTKKILVTSTGRITNPSGGDNYFSVTLYDSSGTIERRSFTMTGNDDGVIFRNVFNNIPFQLGYVIELEYKERNKVLITNFPEEGASHYNPTGSKQYFELTENGLVFGSLSKTSIEVKSFLNQPLATINFNAFEKKFAVSSTFNIAYSAIGSEEYFGISLKNPNESIKKEVSIKGYGTARPFRDELNNVTFEYDDILTLRYKLRDNVLMINYPNLGNIYNPFLEEESFRITQDGLKLAYDFLNNSIIFKNFSNKLLSIVKFNTTLKTLFVVSSDEISNILIGSQEYFALVLMGADGRVKVQNSVKGNQNSKAFKNALNNKTFEYGDTIILRYKQDNIVSVTNYPNTGKIFNPPNNFIEFKITQNGLEI